ncbi:cytochrome d ubiquinol oxidase subunit II [Marinimicrobium sp. ABcell2]|uniref:cytochrome d ubiquinol oxidase subunit II n=1 Tax=Marinimicrobium sp. ABcell2 TaxID=3069751 RepID=UPI0027B02621|nr:cytochrome d ubiquinol oxidase subunit II [Marinimicrobium sp. ABcell2]MDQ2077705.1 cytochrome d ubiquinol oxidase subunit II [Marinimicrobium sp. ABcell2]
MLTGEAYWLPVIFMGLMGLSFLVYATLDGYDLGVGILLPGNSEKQRDIMIASIGPFWDANETWLVLGVGIILIAFPAAHNIILFQLYLPVTLMLAGLILRGVAFDFRAKAHIDHKTLWDWAFKGGSLLATLSQGYMLGLFVMGFAQETVAYVFAGLSAICVTAGYCFMGSSWLVLKTEGELQARAAYWARRSAWLTAIGLIAVSIVNPLISDVVYERWLGDGLALFLLVLPALCAVLFLITDRYLAKYPFEKDFGCWIPFASAVGIFVLSFSALAYSFYPYVVPDQLTIWEAASAPESLRFILVGVIIVLPAILGYTFFAYRVFWGKATELEYY